MPQGKAQLALPSADINLSDLYSRLGAMEAQNVILLSKAGDHDAETKAIQAGISDLKSSIEGIKSDLATAMPVIRRVQKWEQRAIGISLVGGLFGGGLLAQIKGWWG